MPQDPVRDSSAVDFGKAKSSKRTRLPIPNKMNRFNVNTSLIKPSPQRFLACKPRNISHIEPHTVCRPPVESTVLLAHSKVPNPFAPYVQRLLEYTEFSIPAWLRGFPQLGSSWNCQPASPCGNHRGKPRSWLLPAGIRRGLFPLFAKIFSWLEDPAAPLPPFTPCSSEKSLCSAVAEPA
jgi:hypothetical protein